MLSLSAFAAPAWTKGHSLPITDVAWSPDGSQLATCGYDGLVLVWDGEGRVPVKWGSHLRLVNGVRWRPDGGALLSASADQTVHVWDAAAPGERLERLLVLARHTDDVNEAVYCDRMRRIATVSEDGTLRVWNGDSGDPTAVVVAHGDHAMSTDGHPELALVASAGEDGAVRVLDAGTGAVVGGWDVGTGIECIRWSPSGDELAIAGDDGVLRVHRAGEWDAEPRSVELSGVALKSVGWAPSGRRLAAGAYDSRLYLVDAAALAEQASVGSPRLWPRAISWHPSERLVAVSCLDSHPAIAACSETSVELVETGDVRPSRGVNALASARGRLVAAHDSGEVREVETGSVIVRDGSLVNSVACSERLGAVVAGTFAGDVLLARDGARERLPGSAPVNRIAVHPGGALAAVADYLGAVRLISLEPLEQRARVIAHPDGAAKWCVWVDERRLATAGTDGEVAVVEWDGAGGLEVSARLRGHGNLVNCVDAQRVEGRALLVSASRDHTVRVWDADARACVAVHLGHDESVKAVAWRPGSAEFASGSYDGEVRLWRLGADAGPRVRQHPHGISALHWLGPSLLASASWDGTVTVARPA